MDYALYLAQTMTRRTRWKRGVLRAGHAGNGSCDDTNAAASTTQEGDIMALTRRCKAGGTVEEYISGLKQQLEHGQMDLRGVPWVPAPDIFRLAYLTNEQRRCSCEPEIMRSVRQKLCSLHCCQLFSSGRQLYCFLITK